MSFLSLLTRRRHPSSHCPFTELRRTEFSRLDRAGHTYLDYTGGGLYPASLPRRHQALLSNSVLGNPHSINPTSQHATELAEGARTQVLRFFQAEADYYCIFTPNATGALRIVGESFPWSADSQYLLTADNHNSVHGIREYCRRAGGAVTYSPLTEDLCLDASALLSHLERPNPTAAPRLFAYPAQSNSSGVRHDLAWLEEARSKGWYTLLDAAAFVPTSPLDLQRHRPDFVSLSFYKMFGYPTGLGALLVRKDAFERLRKPWFAGGTVQATTLAHPHHCLHDDHGRFEDGTIDYLGLPAVTYGLAFLSGLGMSRLSDRVTALTDGLVHQLDRLHHPDGSPLIRRYGLVDRSDCGGTVLFNILGKSGRIVPFRRVEQRAAAAGISLRAGCFCNPGVDERIHGVSAATLRPLLHPNRSLSFADLMTAAGGQRGAVRVSVGMATVEQDIRQLMHFLSSLTSSAPATPPVN